MKRFAKWLAAAGLAVYLVAGFGGTSEAKMIGSPWRPTFGSPVDFYQIQVDKGTPAAEVVQPIHDRLETTWPDAADNAGPKKGGWVGWRSRPTFFMLFVIHDGRPG